MAKKVKEINMNLYYMHHGQDEQMKKRKSRIFEGNEKML